MSKVAIVGVEGSGKTVLMAAFAEKYGAVSSDSVYLMPESQSAFAFMTHIPHRLRKEHTWPQATSIDALRMMRWTLRVGSEVLSEVEMLDYPGELYRLAFGERTEEELAAHRKEVHEFLEHVIGAELLVVLLNLSDVLEIGGNTRNAETVWITRGILDYAKKVPAIKDVLLVFTQADRYADILKAEGGPSGILKNRLPMIHVLHPDLECLSVSAVDATDEHGNPSSNYTSQGIQALMDRVLLSSEMKKELEAAIKECEMCAQIMAAAKNQNELKNGIDRYKKALAAKILGNAVAKLYISPGICSLCNPDLTHLANEANVRILVEDQRSLLDILESITDPAAMIPRLPPELIISDQFPELRNRATNLNSRRNVMLAKAQRKLAGEILKEIEAFNEKLDIYPKQSCEPPTYSIEYKALLEGTEYGASINSAWQKLLVNVQSLYFFAFNSNFFSSAEAYAELWNMLERTSFTQKVLRRSIQARRADVMAVNGLRSGKLHEFLRALENLEFAIGDADHFIKWGDWEGTFTELTARARHELKRKKRRAMVQVVFVMVLVAVSLLVYLGFWMQKK